MQPVVAVAVFITQVLPAAEAGCEGFLEDASLPGCRSAHVTLHLLVLVPVEKHIFLKRRIGGFLVNSSVSHANLSLVQRHHSQANPLVAVTPNAYLSPVVDVKGVSTLYLLRIKGLPVLCQGYCLCVPVCF